MRKAEELKVKSIALPAISTGIYGYPYEVCARKMAKVLKENWNLDKIIVCLYTNYAYDVFTRGVTFNYF